jgi:hypothetical protein
MIRRRPEGLRQPASPEQLQLPRLRAGDVHDARHDEVKWFLVDGVQDFGSRGSTLAE